MSTPSVAKETRTPILPPHVDVGATRRRASSVAKRDELDVLAQRVDGSRSTTASTVSPSVVGGLQGVEVGRLVGKQRRLSDLLGVSLELVVHAHEVGLAVELDESARRAVLGNHEP